VRFYDGSCTAINDTTGDKLPVVFLTLGEKATDMATLKYIAIIP